MSARHGADVATASLVVNGAHSVLATSDAEIIDLLKGGQGVLNVVRMLGVVSEVDAGSPVCANRQ